MLPWKSSLCLCSWCLAVITSRNVVSWKKENFFGKFGIFWKQEFSWEREGRRGMLSSRGRVSGSAASSFCPLGSSSVEGCSSPFPPDSSSSFSAGWAGEEIPALSPSNTRPNDVPVMNSRWDYVMNQFSQFICCALLLFGLTTQLKVH